MDCIIYVAKTKTLISFAVTVNLICVFVFRMCETLVSHHAAYIWAGGHFGHVTRMP